MTTHPTDTKLVVYCDCQDPAHIMQFQLAVWNSQEPDLYVSVQLNQVHPWWKRCWIGLSYIMGKRSRFSYGHWDEGSISPESAKQLVALLGKYLTLLNSGTTSTGIGSEREP